MMNCATSKLTFDEDTIRLIFGHEAAEDETIDRLKAYYVKTAIYESMRSNLPLLILVGHKGIGKSALLKMLATEDLQLENIAITIQPNDILRVNTDIPDNFLQRIEMWKTGIAGIIFNKLILTIKDLLLQKVKS